MLIDAEQDEKAILDAEDAAIRAELRTPESTPLDALAWMLTNDPETPVHPEAEASGGPRG